MSLTIFQKSFNLHNPVKRLYLLRNFTTIDEYKIKHGQLIVSTPRDNRSNMMAYKCNEARDTYLPRLCEAHLNTYPWWLHIGFELPHVAYKANFCSIHIRFFCICFYSSWEHYKYLCNNVQLYWPYITPVPYNFIRNADLCNLLFKGDEGDEAWNYDTWFSLTHTFLHTNSFLLAYLANIIAVICGTRDVCFISVIFWLRMNWDCV